MASRRTLLLALACAIAQFALGQVAAEQSAKAQGPTYGVGKTPTSEEVKAWDITISPKGTELPQGHGSAKEGTALFVSKGCAGCHGASGSGGRAPMLIKPADPAAKPAGPCLSPCINESNVMALHAPFATILWDYINRGMPLNREGTLKPDEVYAITAFLLYKNGVIADESQVLDKESLPKVKMPNADGFVEPHQFHHGMKALENYP